MENLMALGEEWAREEEVAALSLPFLSSKPGPGYGSWSFAEFRV